MSKHYKMKDRLSFPGVIHMMKEFIEKIPKAELLVHIEGTLESPLLQKLAAQNKVILPAHFTFNNLASFQELYYSCIKVLVTENDFYELTLSYLEKAAAQNILHTEISFDPQAHLERGIAFETVINGLQRAIQEAKKKYAISATLILCFLRELSVEAAQEILLKALEFKDWIVAIGLDSLEMKSPPEKFSELFARAREYGFMTIAAAGETGPAEFIWQAMDTLKVSRINYALNCIDDIDLMSRLALTKIPVSVCPVSSVKLGLIQNMRQHPLKKMYDEGMCITINSDNPGYFKANLTDNYLLAQSTLRMDKNEIYEIVKNSFTASFLDHNKQEKFLYELDKFVK
jgi:adenosine deaminase